MINKDHNLAAALKSLNARKCGYTSHSYTTTPKGVRVARYSVSCADTVESISHRRAVGDDPTQNASAMELMESIATRGNRVDSFVMFPDYSFHTQVWGIADIDYVPRPLTFDVDNRRFFAVPSRNQHEFSRYIVPILRTKGIISTMLSGDALLVALDTIDNMLISEHITGSMIARVTATCHHAVDTVFLTRMNVRYEKYCHEI